MSRTVYISIFIITLAAASFLLMIKNDSQAVTAFADDKYSMAVEYLLPENDIISFPDHGIRFSSEIIDLTNDQGQNYFVNYRIKREQMRQETKEMLGPLLESDILETRQQAQKRWLELSDKIAKEGEIENILKIQGFKDVICDVNGNKANITILSEELTQEEISNIKKVACSVTGIYTGNIGVKAKN